MASAKHVLSFSKLIDSVTNLTGKSENFLRPQNSAALTFIKNTKILYDWNYKIALPSGQCVDKLYIDDFTDEQIWQQIELYNELYLKKHENLSLEESIEDCSVNGELEESEDEDKEGDEEMETETSPISKKQDEGEDELSSEVEEEKDDDMRENEDELKLPENEEDLEGDSDLEESDEEEKLKDILVSASDEDDDDAELRELDNEGNEDEEMEDLDSDDINEEKRGKDLLASDSDGEDASDILGKQVKKSSFEKRNEKMKGMIQNLEETNLAEKPWQLKGEVAAKARPENSLLQEHLDFDVSAKPSGEMTEEDNLSIETLIKQRIKDKFFDDVERKVKKIENIDDYKNKIVLDQGKSTKSLAEIYAEEYLKQTGQSIEEDEREDPVRKEIKDDMQSLFGKLDALSDSRFIPKPAAPDIKIITNQSTIHAEEVAPVTKTDVSQMAPEEISMKRKGDIKSSLEKTTTDRKRDRRLKKKVQHLKKVRKEKLEKNKKVTKKSALAELTKQAAGNKNINVIKENSDKRLSSSNFFHQLHNTIQPKSLKDKHI
ncbi:DgyrCDS11447 [Dimorphilus gyrociliatus]|uniref:U3 small nucleolar ribonucleoprotein protein MPP10 n=1 Tax=Dimorphilus gyrociliatus TaxID=2664684 RepID=A0A7I8W4E8_9ANNE|nr:DgyrCDS11447 [Dimorphilus gyrociliatus]